MKPIDNFILAKYQKEDGEKVTVTVSNYKKFVKDKDKEKISNFIYERLYGRYLKPFMYKCPEYEKNYKNGFAIMANGCLLIETLCSFKKGWGTTKNKGEVVFVSFFKENKNFSLTGKGFYKNIRCGILHQGETTGGWKIRRNGKTDSNTKIINANSFSRELRKSLREYCKNLKDAEWDDEIWDNCRIKMCAIIKNCQQ